MAVLKDLIVHGNSRFLNGAQFNKIKTEEISAGTGNFNTLTAVAGKINDLTTETLETTQKAVIANLDVKGELHTSQWTNSNIATIDGSFYITPTIGSTTGTLTITNPVTSNNVTSYTMTISGSNFPISSLYVNTADTTGGYSSWTTSSKVLVTGEVLIGNTYKPLGTLTGELGSTVSASTIIVTNLKDNHYQTAATLTDIGVQTSSVTYRNIKISLYQKYSSSAYRPLGIFMTALGTNGTTFLDIYGGSNALQTVNNTIGGVTYDSGAFAKPTLRIGNLAGLPTLSLPNGTSVTPQGWGIYTNNGFFTGTIVSTQGKIGNFTLGTAIYGASSGTGPSTVSATSTAGTYLGTDGFLNTASSTTYAQITNGVLTAQGAVIKGALTATSLATGTKTGSTSGNGVFIDSSGNMYVGNGSTNNFTVTAAGAVTAKSGTIGGWSINSSYGIYTNSKTSATSTNSGILIQKDGNIYAGAYNSTAASCPFQVTNTGVLTAVNANLKGLTIYDSSGKKRAGVESTGFIIYDGASATTTTQLAVFGSTVQIGASNSTHTNIDSTGMKIYASDGTTLIAHLGYGEGAAQTSGTTATAPYCIFGLKESNTTNGNYSVGEGYHFNASGWASHAEGYYTQASGSSSHAEGDNTIARGDDSHAEGYQAIANGGQSHAEGYYTKANSDYSHAEGYYTTADGNSCHAEGESTTASNVASHAEGRRTTASGYSSHAEGYNTLADGNYSHAEGYYSKARQPTAHAEGGWTVADGTYSHTNGKYTVATEEAQTVIGKYNTATRSGSGTEASPYTYTGVGNYAFIIGNGSGDATADRSNALTVDWSGNSNQQGRATTADMSASNITSFVNNLTVGGGNTAVDLVIEQGISGMWTYRKWSSGIAECWGKWSGTIANYYSSGNGLYGFKLEGLAFPSGLFNAEPIVTADGYTGTGFYLGTRPVVSGSGTSWSVQLISMGTASGSVSCYYYVNAKGFWK